MSICGLSGRRSVVPSSCSDGAIFRPRIGRGRAGDDEARAQGGGGRICRRRTCAGAVERRPDSAGQGVSAALTSDSSAFSFTAGEASAAGSGLALRAISISATRTSLAILPIGPTPPAPTRRPSCGEMEQQQSAVAEIARDRRARPRRAGRRSAGRDHTDQTRTRARPRNPPRAPSSARATNAP